MLINARMHIAYAILFHLATLANIYVSVYQQDEFIFKKNLFNEK